MSKTMIRHLVLSVAGLLAAPVAWSAAETGFYVGGFFGVSDRQDDTQVYDLFSARVVDFAGLALDTRATTLDSGSKTYGFTGGYRLFQNFAIEGGYMTLGTSKFRDRSRGIYPGNAATDTTPATPDVPANLLVNVDNEIGGIAVSALGILPLSYRFEVYGRAGVMFSTHDFKVFFNDDQGGPGIKDSRSENSTDLLAGAGASMMLAEVYTLRAEVIRVFDAGDEVNGEGDVDLFTLGVTVKF